MRKICAFIVAAAVLVLSAPIAARASTVTYEFIGQCYDCTGTGIGYLTLSDYTLGTNLSNSNFVSFTYQSNLINLSYSGIGTDPNQLMSIQGLIPPTLPATADVFLYGFQQYPTFAQLGYIFRSNVNGAWCVGTQDCSADYGFSHEWTVTPIPPALPLFATGLGALGLLGWRRKRKQVAA